MKIGRFEIKLIVHPKICKGEMKHQDYYHDGAEIFACTKCNYSEIGYESTVWKSHKKSK